MNVLSRIYYWIFNKTIIWISKSISLNKTYEKSVSAGRNRTVIIHILIWAVYSIIAIRIVLVGGFPEDMYTKKPSYAPKKTITRESIYDRKNVLVADFLNSDRLYVNPKMVRDVELLKQQLLEIFPQLNSQKLHRKLTRNSSFVWLVRKLTPKQKYKVNALGDISLNFIKAKTRIYPHENLLSHILGYVNIDNVGQSGIERVFDKLLSVDEKPVHLTIDTRIQYIVRSQIIDMIEKTSAKGGMGIVMNVNNGEVLAMTSLPDFDPNEPNKNMQNLLNKNSHAIYELGSTFKILNTAIALESGKVSIRDSFDAIQPIKVSKFKINDYHAQKRLLSVPEIFIHSSNIGSVKMALKAGINLQIKKMRELNMLEPLNIILPERAKTMYPKYWKKTETATISFGHGISVTPLHLAAAVSAIINGGTYYRPLFVKGEVAKGKTVFSNKTSKQIRKLMYLNTLKGSGKLSKREGYLIGGKTGTAEKPKQGGYDSSAILASYIAGFPIHNPKYLVYVIIDEPQPSEISKGLRPTGSWVASPVVGNIIESIAPMLNVNPIDENNPAIKRAMEIPSPYNKGEI